MKKPWLAALLSVIPLPVGLGYLYLGQAGRFLLALFGGIAAAIVGVALYVGIASFLFYGLGCGISRSCELYHLLFTVVPLPIVVLAGFTARDAWRLAVANNQLGSRFKKPPRPLSILILSIVPGFGLGYRFLHRWGRLGIAFLSQVFLATTAGIFLALWIIDGVNYEPWIKDAIGGLVALASWFVVVGVTAWDSYLIASRGSPGIFPHGLTGKGKLAAAALAVVLVAAVVYTLSSREPSNPEMFLKEWSEVALPSELVVSWHVANIVPSPNGGVWLSAGADLFHYDGERFHKYATTGRVELIGVDQQNRAWVIGAPGLPGLDNERVVQIAPPEDVRLSDFVMNSSGQVAACSVGPLLWTYNGSRWNQADIPIFGGGAYGRFFSGFGQACGYAGFEIDSEGMVWIAGWEKVEGEALKVMKFDGEKWESLVLPSSDLELRRDSQQRVFGVTRDGSGRSRIIRWAETGWTDEGEVPRLLKPSRFSEYHLWPVLVDGPGGTKWVGGPEGVFILEKGKRIFLSRGSGLLQGILPFDEPHHIVVDAEQRVWLADGYSLYGSNGLVAFEKR